MAVNARGPIKVGSGYIDIFPKMNQKALAGFRKELNKAMGIAGVQSGKEFAKGVSQGMAGLPKQAAAAARKAQKAVQKEAVDSAKKLKAIERELTREFGREAAARFRAFRDQERQKQKLLQGTSQATRRAIQATVREEQQAAQQAARAWQQAERQRIALIRQREQEAKRAERAQAAAARAAQRQILAEQRAALMAQRQTIQENMLAQRQTIANLRRDLQGFRRDLQNLTTNTQGMLKRLQSAWQTQASHIRQLGTAATEAGRIITTNLLAPLGLVAGKLTEIGVKSADMRLLGQLGLTHAGVSTKKSAQEIRRVQEYAIATPFSINTMHEYQMKFIRSIASRDKEWYNPKTRERAANRAAEKATDIIMAVGDSMAAAGNLDPQMFSRAMYAIDRMLDLDKAPTRNINQLISATGIPANEFARLLGFADAGEFWKKVGTPVAKGGGVTGSKLVEEGLLQFWDPKGDKKGSRGMAAKMSSKTITGRIEQMRERAIFELGNLFLEEDKKTGELRYTELGDAIMGKGGLLDAVKELGKGFLDFLEDAEVLKTFLDQIKRIVGWGNKLLDILKEHPKIRETLTTIVEFGVVLAPLLLALGAATKAFGLLNKVMASGLTPIRGAIRAGRAGSRVARQIAAGDQAMFEGRSFREGYRERRAQLRGGDDRGPFRRMWDAILGRNSQVNRIRQQMQDTEDAIREAQDELQRLQRELQNVNRQRLNQLQNQISGGNNSLTGAANRAQNQIRQIQTQGVTPLNQSSLANLRNQFQETEQKAQALKKEIRDTAQEVGKLNERKLGSLRSQQIQTTETRTNALKSALNKAGVEVNQLNSKKLDQVRKQVIDTTQKGESLRSKINAVGTAIGNLNRRSLSGVRDQFDNLHKSVSKVYDKVGTSKVGLGLRITNLNSRKLTSIIDQVNKLKSALDGASDKAEDLDSNVRAVNADTGGGGGGGKGKKKKGGTPLATGGVLPGYAPGVDSIPAMLSPGEAVLRPEVARAIGAETINAWNAAAIKGQIKGYAKGTAGAGLPNPVGISRRMSMASIARLLRSTIFFDEAGAGVDRRAGTRLVPWGSRSGGRHAGRGFTAKARGMTEYFTKELPRQMRASAGPGALLGLIAGAVAPNIGEYFWDDVWKGHGNILERAGRFATHVFNPVNIWNNLKESGTDIVDMVKAIGKEAEGLLTDPIGTITNHIKSQVTMYTQAFTGIFDQIKAVQSIANNPSQYAAQVMKEFMATAREAMPNTKGLWNFADGGIVPGYSPDDDRVRALLSPGEAVLRPEAVRALGVANIAALNKAAKAGKLPPKKDNSKVIIPAPDAEAFKTAVEKIESSLQDGRTAIDSTRKQSNTAWQDTGAKVRSSVDVQIRPAMKRMVAEATTLQSKSKSALNGVKSSASSTASSTRKSFGDMQSGLKNLEKSFSNAQKNISGSMGKVPTAVKGNVREAISFIQRAMVSPVNQKLLAPAKLKGIPNLPQYAKGGVLPGYAPGQDSILAMLSPGESILRPEVTKALGEDTIHALNAGAMKGKLPAFATGGIIGDWDDIDLSETGSFKETAEPIIKKTLAKFISGVKRLAWMGGIMHTGAEKGAEGVVGQLAIKDKVLGIGGPSVQRALRWARTQSGKPYQWGGNGNPSWDCSGFMSAIESVIRGQRPHRRWSTHAFRGGAPEGWVRNLKSPFMIGVTHAGVGHTAGTINGVNVESRGGDGVIVGKRARGWNDPLFTAHYGFRPAIPTGYANGTLSASPGLHLVGERGRELVHFRGGERVFSNEETEAILRGRNVTINVYEAKHETTPDAVVRGLQEFEALYGGF